MEEKNAAGAVVKTYTIADDVITQATSTSIEHLLYDGHGSTRQLVDSSEDITAAYSYDAYGVMLGGNPGTPQNPGTPATNLLYAGEQFDTNLQMYYNRARYYDQNTGRFNRLDPFAGNNEDPQSLHKYLYCHANPITNIDPTGRISLAEVTVGTAVAAVLSYIFRIMILTGLAMLAFLGPYIAHRYTGLAYLKITKKFLATDDEMTYTVVIHNVQEFAGAIREVDQAYKEQVITFFEFVGHGFGGDQAEMEKGWGLSMGRYGDEGFVTGPHPDPQLAHDTAGLIFFDDQIDVIKRVFHPEAVIELETCYSAYDCDSIAYKFKRALPKASVWGFTGEAYPVALYRR